MARKKKELIDEPEVEATTTEEAVAEEAPKGAISIKVTANYPSGPKQGSIRVFSKEKHGADFKKLAEAYKERFDGKVV